MSDLPVATEIVAPLVRRRRAGKAGIVLVTYPGNESPYQLVQDVESVLADNGLKAFRVGLGELAPEPVARLAELRDRHGTDIFSIDCSAEQLGDGALVSALNIHRNTYARKGLCAIFWMPAQGMQLFARKASNFLDFRTRLVEVDQEGQALRLMTTFGKFDTCIVLPDELGAANVRSEKGLRLESYRAQVSQAAETEADLLLARHGFIGRDDEVLRLDQAMHQDRVSILIVGIGGIGKSTLVAGFLRWLRRTGGLGYPPFWFNFNEIRGTESLLNLMGTHIFGETFLSQPARDKLEVVTSALRELPLVIVWDSFERVRGIAGTAVSATLGSADQRLLHDLLVQLSGGRSKVLITSRSHEDWLEPEICYRLPLAGLKGEERWQYATKILGEIGIAIDRDDAAMAGLLEQLGGHPLAMQVTLPMLAHQAPSELTDTLSSALSRVSADDEDIGHLSASLGLVVDTLPVDLHPLLILLGLHERFVAAVELDAIAAAVDPSWSPSRIDTLLESLASAGLLHVIGDIGDRPLLRIHPMLTGWLRTDPSVTEAVQRDTCGRAFVERMGWLADQSAQQRGNEQREVFRLHEASFHNALSEARRLGMSQHVTSLLQAIAVFAQNSHDLGKAEQGFQELLDHHQKLGHEENEAAALHHLGIIAEERNDLDAAERWSLRSLEIAERLGYEASAARTYHQLGRIAEQRRDLDSAERWHKRSLEIKERLGNEAGAAITYHQLGIIAEERRDRDTAERWYLRALEIDARLGNESGASVTFHQLGLLAEERQDFDAAERWYLRSLEIKERLGNARGAAITLGQLGVLNGLRGEYEQGGRRLIRSILGLIRANDKPGADRNVGNLQSLFKEATPEEREKLRRLWEESNLAAPFGHLTAPEESG
jgi:tetratricopeptide (TPR) repeat protein